jgi:hypothetical protein
MEADPTSGEEQVQPKKKNPGREEAPAPLPVPVPAPAAGPAFFIDRLELLEAKMKAKIGRDRVAPKLGLIPPLPHPPQASPHLANWYLASVAQIVPCLFV